MLSDLPCPVAVAEPKSPSPRNSTSSQLEIVPGLTVRLAGYAAQYGIDLDRCDLEVRDTLEQMALSRVREKGHQLRAELIQKAMELRIRLDWDHIREEEAEANFVRVRRRDSRKALLALEATVAGCQRLIRVIDLLAGGLQDYHPARLGPNQLTLFFCIQAQDPVEAELDPKYLWLRETLTELALSDDPKQHLLTALLDWLDQHKRRLTARIETLKPAERLARESARGAENDPELRRLRRYEREEQAQFERCRQRLERMGFTRVDRQSPKDTQSAVEAVMAAQNDASEADRPGECSAIAEAAATVSGDSSLPGGLDASALKTFEMIRREEGTSDAVPRSA